LLYKLHSRECKWADMGSAEEVHEDMEEETAGAVAPPDTAGAAPPAGAGVAGAGEATAAANDPDDEDDEDDCTDLILFSSAETPPTDATVLVLALAGALVVAVVVAGAPAGGMIIPGAAGLFALSFHSLSLSCSHSPWTERVSKLSGPRSLSRYVPWNQRSASRNRRRWKGLWKRNLRVVYLLCKEDSRLDEEEEEGTNDAALPEPVVTLVSAVRLPGGPGGSMPGGSTAELVRVVRPLYAPSSPRALLLLLLLELPPPDPPLPPPLPRGT